MLGLAVIVVQLLSQARLFLTPWTAACQVFLSLTIRQTSPKFQSIELVMPSNPLPSHPLLASSPFAFNLSQHQGLSQWVDCLHQLAKVLELHHLSFQWGTASSFVFPVRLICFKIDAFDPLDAQGLLSLFQHHGLKASGMDIHSLITFLLKLRFCLWFKMIINVNHNIYIFNYMNFMKHLGLIMVFITMIPCT